MVYIAGFVVRKAMEKLSCDQCLSVLVSQGDVDISATCLVKRKSRGGLLLPSADVVVVCKVCERFFRTLFREHGGKPPSGNKVRCQLNNQVMSYLMDSDVFASLTEHSMETDPLNDHRVRLIKRVCDHYFGVRFYHAGKVYTRSLQGDKVRSVLTKAIIFKGQ